MSRILSGALPKLLCGLVVLLAFAIVEHSALSQLPTATILGTVKDASGAVVPGASLTARSTETGQTRTVVSAGDGSYRFSGLPVGGYEVRVEQSGFQTAVRSGLTLAVAQEAVVNFSLEVGAVTQTVAVTAEAPLVNTTSGTLGGLVSEQRVADLPLNGRNFIDLSLLQAGVQAQPGARVQTVQYGVWLSTNGAPVFSNRWILDGAEMLNAYGGTPAATSGDTPGVEGIREYRVLTNSFSAEYGMAMGSQTIMVSKGGTNDFHGSLFEYLRNSAMDARNFFDYKTAASRRRLPNFARNNFGAAVGGPIQRDRTFFHSAYEGIREAKGESQVLPVFSTTCRETPTACTGGAPANPNMVRLMREFYPAPNLGSDLFVYPFNRRSRLDYGQARVDRTFSDTDTLFGRYTIQDAHVVLPENLPQFDSIRTSRDQFATMAWDHIFSPTLLNTFRLSYSHNDLTNSTTGAGVLPPELWFLPKTPYMPVAGTPFISTSGLTNFGPLAYSFTHYKKNIYVLGNDMFYTRGRHALKFGGLVNNIRYMFQNPYFTRGWAIFAGPPQTGGGPGAFLRGQPASLRAAIHDVPLDRTYHHWTFGFYVQDDFRATSNLTLNLGLRYEVAREIDERFGRGVSFRDIRNDPGPTLGHNFVKNPTLRNFGPRFGFAWDVQGDGKTAVRGGFGLLYDMNAQAFSLIQGACSAPTCHFRVQGGPPAVAAFGFPLRYDPPCQGVAPGVPCMADANMSLDYRMQQPHMLHYNLGVERQLPGDMSVSLRYVGSRGLNLAGTTDGNPVVPGGIAVAGPAGRLCVAPNDPRASTLTRLAGVKCWMQGDSRIRPDWGMYQLYTAASNSWYNGLQVEVQKRLSRGWQFQSSYTWAKVIDEPQGQTSGASTLKDPSNRKSDRGVAAFDVSHNWRFNSIYRLPNLVDGGGVAGALLNGWQISGILSLQTGYPLNINVGSNRSSSGVLGGVEFDRPDLAPGVKAADITSGNTAGCRNIPAGRLGTADRWFDPCAFVEQPVGFLGNAGRNIVRGPGLANVDFSVRKNTPLRFLGESGSLEFRAEVFNILNRVNFDLPDVNAFAATGGRILSTVRESRQIQLALKIVF